MNYNNRTSRIRLKINKHKVSEKEFYKICKEENLGFPLLHGHEDLDELLSFLRDPETKKILANPRKYSVI
jgi:hypothetical protein